MLLLLRVEQARKWEAKAGRRVWLLVGRGRDGGVREGLRVEMLALALALIGRALRLLGRLL
jgi:hypothetical protein